MQFHKWKCSSFPFQLVWCPLGNQNTNNTLQTLTPHHTSPHPMTTSKRWFYQRNIIQATTGKDHIWLFYNLCSTSWYQKLHKTDGVHNNIFTVVICLNFAFICYKFVLDFVHICVSIFFKSIFWKHFFLNGRLKFSTIIFFLFLFATLLVPLEIISIGLDILTNCGRAIIRFKNLYHAFVLHQLLR